jgi:hypothetical protein
MQVHVGPSMEKVELSSDLKFLSKVRPKPCSNFCFLLFQILYDFVKSAKSRVQIQIEWFKVLQIGIENIYNLALVSSSNSLRILHDK